ncbi:MAG: TetR family transcriptional regulator [Gammaproteobacteria bacterium]|nr:MAG: TetR family transcriptional regulator [Gammaproteobacteria bacterium]
MAGRCGQGRRFDTQKALDAAVEVFWRHGYEGTSISVLTSAMGITASSLYAAFGGKRQLFDLVVERYMATKGRFARLAFEQETHALPLIRRLLFEAARQYTNQDGQGGCLLASTATCVTDANCDIEKQLEQRRNAYVQGIEDVVRSDIDAGVLPDAAEPRMIASFVGAVLLGMAQRARDGATEQDLTETAEMAFAQVQQAFKG